MKWNVRIVVAVLISSCCPPASAAKYVRVGSFNIANFGASESGEYERSLVSLVNIVMQMDADVIALQEIEPTAFGAEQMQRFMKLLNKAAGYYRKPLYEYVIAEEYTGDETTAFLWREPATLESEIMLLEHEPDGDGDGLPTFQRVPHYALFRAGNYDFYLVNCHLYTKVQGDTSQGRGAEFAALAAWLKDLAAETEKDAVVVGDFNRFLNGKSAWKQLMIPGHEKWFRFALLEGIANDVEGFDPSKDEVPSDVYSTTTAQKNSIYDQIIVSQGSYAEFSRKPCFGVDVGIVAFDREAQFEWVTDQWYDAIKVLSDHRPAWIRLRIDQDDDD